MAKRKTKQETTISPKGITLIIASIAAAIFFCWQIYGNLTEIDSKLIGDYMKDAATSMQRIKSYSGNSVAEAYYNDQGEYLEGESKIYNAQIWFQKRISLALDVLGLLFCLLILFHGASQKTTRVASPKSSSVATTKGEQLDEDI